MIQFTSNQITFEASNIREIIDRLESYGCEILEETFEIIEETYLEALEKGEAEFFDFSCPEDKFEIKCI